MGLRVQKTKDSSVAETHEDYAVSLAGWETNLTREELTARVRELWLYTNRDVAAFDDITILNRGATTATVRIFFHWLC